MHAPIGRANSGVDAANGIAELMDRKDADRHRSVRRQLQVIGERIRYAGGQVKARAADRLRDVPDAKRRVRQLSRQVGDLVLGGGQLDLGRGGGGLTVLWLPGQLPALERSFASRL